MQSKRASERAYEIEATVCVSGGAPYLRVEEGDAVELGGSHVRAVCRGRRFAAATMRLPGETTVLGLALPRSIQRECELEVGARVTVEIERPGNRGPQAPSDAEEALAAAGADLSLLDLKERRLAVTLVREAGSPQIRQERIDALVEACLEASQRN